MLAHDNLLKRIALNPRLALSGASLIILVILVGFLNHGHQDNTLVWTAPVEPPGTVIITRQEMPAPAREDQPGASQDPVPATSASLAKTQLLKAIDLWADAWRRRDVAAYLGHYGPGFETPAGMSRQVWTETRTDRISNKEKIDIAIRNLTVQLRNDRATVRFTQIYADERLRMTDRKTMVWVRHDGRWMIQKENTH